MEIRFNVTGSKRKELVGIISQVTGCKQIYKGMPSAAYEVADITISKDGTVSYDERTEESTIKAILEQTAAAGFAAELDEARPLKHQKHLAQQKQTFQRLQRTPAW